MRKSIKNKKKIHFFGLNVKAFSSLELILIIAIVTVIGLTSIPFLSRFFTQSATSDTYNRLLAEFRTAQTNAILGKQKGPWGVYYGVVNGSKEVILYQGTSYAAHTNKAFDQVYAVNPNVTVTGFSDINFSQVSGIPNISTTITISSPGNTTKTIQIDSHGIVNYAPAGPTNTPAPTPTVTPTPRPTNTPTPTPTPTLIPTPTPFTTTVTNLHVTSVGTTTIGIAWNASPRATNYQVRVTYQTQVIDTEFTSGKLNWTVTGLTNNQTYGLHVAAIDDTYWAPEASISQKTNP